MSREYKCEREQMCLESISVRERTNVSREYKCERENKCV